MHVQFKDGSRLKFGQAKFQHALLTSEFNSLTPDPLGGHLPHIAPIDQGSSLSIPISSTSYSFPVLINFTLSPLLILPLKTLNRTSIPLKEL